MLQSDLVVVPPLIFHEREKHKSVFIVAWKEIEGKFAITCHSGTAQRQRICSQEPMGTPVPDGSHSLCHGSLEPGAAEYPSLGLGWLSAQWTKPRENPLLSGVWPAKDKRVPSVARRGARPACFAEARNPEMSVQCLQCL
ncbi:Junction-mediating and -regulatory protein [Lemmus lemmus]